MNIAGYIRHIITMRDSHKWLGDDYNEILIIFVQLNQHIIETSKKRFENK